MSTPSAETSAETGAEPEAARELRATDAQRLAIETRGGDVVVSAGAGSGKTFVLVERFMGLVREGVAPERILTITFTERAAHEMKERIGKALEADGRADGRRVAEGAWISTIHGFCSRLLRERALEAGVDPTFAVMTDVPAARVRRAAYLRALEEFRSDAPGVYDGLVERVRWAKGQDGAIGIRRQVFDLYDQIRAAGHSLSEEVTQPGPLDAIDLPQVQVALEQLAEELRCLTGAMSSSRRTQRLEKQSIQVRRLMGKLAEIPLDGFRPELYRVLRDLAKACGGGGSLALELGRAREAAEHAASLYAEGPARALGRGLEDLLRRFDQWFRALKAEHSALDFTDLEERTRDLLKARPDVREDVQRRFQAVFVDEFQDTSVLQQTILDQVRREGGLFVVGDVKQSIYGFRHANVRGLLGLWEQALRSQEENPEEPLARAIPLDVSFRTRPELLTYTNEVFERLWAEPGSEVPHQPLQPGVEFGEASRPCVEVLVGHGDGLNRARQGEARGVAARLATLIEGQQLKGTNPLREESFGKPLRYRDCAILVPATTALRAYERALRDRGVPYRVSSGRGFYGAQEVVDAVKLLRVTAAAHDDLALLALLRSPAVGLSDDALFRLSLAREGRASLHEVLETCECLELTEEDAQLALQARELLDTLRSMRGRNSTREILARGLELSGLLDGSLLGAGDVRAFANLQKLLSVVDDLEREGVSGPAAVAGVLEDLRASDARESEANVSAEDEDAVQLLTVHASKGLEWPLVVVADLGRGKRPTQDPILWSKASGVTLNLRDPDGSEAMTPRSLQELWETGAQRAREESKRLLYVAMTRARDHLILAGAQSARARSVGDWLTWSRCALPPNQRPTAGEMDLAVGGMARAYLSRDGIVVRCVDVHEEALDEPLHGPRGPAADARPVLDARECLDLERGKAPKLPQVEPEVAVEAKSMLARALDPQLPPLDQGSSLYTVSEILTWRGCPRRALFEHVVGDEGERPQGQGGGGNVPADVRGTLVHELLARGLAHGVASPKRARQRLEQLLLPDEANPAALGRTVRWARERTQTFLESPLGRDAAAHPESRVEFPFLVSFSPPEEAPFLLRGTVDLLFPDPERPGAWILADYKSSEITALEVPGRLAEHELQVHLYALGLQAMGIEVSQAYVVYLAPEVVSPVDVTASTLDAARETLQAFVEARNELDLPPTPSLRQCRWCPWSTPCPDAATPDRPRSSRNLALAPARA